MSLKREGIKALLVDLEGTLYSKGARIPGAEQALALLKQMGVHLTFLTNTDSKSSSTIKKDLSQMGLEVEEAEIFSPADALLRFLDNNSSVESCYLLLSEELSKVFKPYATTGVKVKYVVVGDFRESVSYEVLNTAFGHIVAGADIVALQKGLFFIRNNGRNLDTGAFVHLLERASGKEARVLGKPSVDFFQMALEHAGFMPEETAVVGDDLSTDILGANKIGAPSILVRTGKYDAEAAARSPIRPDFVVGSIADVPQLIVDGG